MRTLSTTEARVLGTLMEKARTVPDSYPLTLNALVAGCNQKTSRDPLMNVTDGQAQEALDALRLQSLVLESSSSRVARWEHNFQRAMVVPEQSAVLLGLLLLRGPQTAAEMRLNGERWYRFADISSVEGFLDELQERSEDKGGPLVVRLARAPGTREQRWAHLLGGPPVQAAAGGGDAPQESTPQPALEARIEALEQDLAALRSTVQNMAHELGMSPPGQAQ